MQFLYAQNLKQQKQNQQNKLTPFILVFWKTELLIEEKTKQNKYMSKYQIDHFFYKFIQNLKKSTKTANKTILRSVINIE